MELGTPLVGDEFSVVCVDCWTVVVNFDHSKMGCVESPPAAGRVFLGMERSIKSLKNREPSGVRDITCRGYV